MGWGTYHPQVCRNAVNANKMPMCVVNGTRNVRVVCGRYVCVCGVPTVCRVCVCVGVGVWCGVVCGVCGVGVGVNQGTGTGGV